jgi:hypothetical protein
MLLKKETIKKKKKTKQTDRQADKQTNAKGKCTLKEIFQ